MPDADASARSRATPPQEVTREELAPLGRRVGALAVDWAIAMAIGYGFLDGHPFGILGVFAVQRVLVGWLTGSSIGHRMFGLRLVTLYRQRASLLVVAVRTVLLCLVLPGVWRTIHGVPLHDDLARTRLVRLG